MRNVFSGKKKIVFVLCLILAALVVMIGGTFAIYTSQDYQRSVVRNRDNDIIRFSSDKLERVTQTEERDIRKYYPVEKNVKNMSFYVCNYDQTKSTLYHESKIDYTISFEVKNGTGSSYSITCGNETKSTENGGTCSFFHSLVGGKKSLNSYTFTFAEEDYNTVELYVTVTPTNPALVQNRILKGVLIPMQYTSAQGVSVTAEFTDRDRGVPKDFAAYNLLVSISGGEQWVEITWDQDKLDIDPFILQNIPEDKRPPKMNGIKLLMNSEDETGSYLIQFYNHGSDEQKNWTSWSDLGIAVNGTTIN